MPFSLFMSTYNYLFQLFLPGCRAGTLTSVLFVSSCDYSANILSKQGTNYMDLACVTCVYVQLLSFVARTHHGRWGSLALG